MKTFTDSELFEMFSLGGCDFAEGPAIVGEGPIAAPYSAGEPWNDSDWQLAQRKPKAKTRQYREDDGLSESDHAKLVQYHAERIAIGGEYIGDWRKILEL